MNTRTEHVHNSEGLCKLYTIYLIPKPPSFSYETNIHAKPARKFVILLKILKNFCGMHVEQRKGTFKYLYLNLKTRFRGFF